MNKKAIQIGRDSMAGVIQRTESSAICYRTAHIISPRLLFPVIWILLLYSLLVPCVQAADPPEKETSAYKMESMVVTGSRTSTESPEKMSVPVQVITGEELQEIGAVSLGQALEGIQGVELVQSPDMNTAPGVQTLRMRGMDASHVLVLINGRRQPGTRPDKDGFSFTDISGINISDIERIEVLRDGASAQYGSDAVAGVINIVMRKYNPSLSVSSQYGISAQGDAEEKQLEVSSGIPAGKALFFNIGANGWQSEHYDRTPDNPRWTSPEVDQKGGNIKGSLEINPYQVLDADLRYNQTETVIRIGRTGSLNKDRISKKKDYYGGLTWEGDIKGLYFESGLGLSRSDTEYRRGEDPDYEGDVESDLRDGYIHMNWGFRNWLTFFFGSSYSHESVDAAYRDFVETRDVFALFGESSLTFFKRLSIQISGRLEEYSDFGTNLAPKVSARYEWSNNLAFRASASSSFQVPTLYQLHDRFIGAMGWNDIYGNPDLAPSEGVSFNVGFTWTPFWPEGFSLSADCYSNEIDNMIETLLVSDATANTNAVTTYTNLEGTSTFRGVEIEGGLPLFWGFRLDASAGLLFARDPDDEDLTNRQRSRFNSTLSYNKDRFSANLRYVYRGKYLSDSSPIEKIEPFDFFNAQINYKLTSSINLFVGGRNLLDETPPVDLEKYEGGHMESMIDSTLGAYYYGGVRVSF